MTKKKFKGKFNSTDTIVVLVAGNPKQEGTDAYWKYELLRNFDGKTVQDYCAAVSEIKAHPDGSVAQKFNLTPKQAQDAVAEGAGREELKWCLEDSRRFIALKSF